MDWKKMVMYEPILTRCGFCTQVYLVENGHICNEDRKDIPNESVLDYAEKFLKSGPLLTEDLVRLMNKESGRLQFTFGTLEYRLRKHPEIFEKNGKYWSLKNEVELA